MSTGTARAARRRRRLTRSPWFHVLLALVVVALVQGFFVKVYQVPSGSMEETLEAGDRVLVNRTAYSSAEPQRGDVVVFRKPAGWGAAPEHGALRTAVGWLGELTGIGPGNTEYLVKRIIGLPGDTVECCDAAGRVEVNGSGIDEPYVYQDLPFDAAAGMECSTAANSPRCFRPLHLATDQYLLLGDHRANSEDSVAACRAAAAQASCVRTAQRSDLVGTVDWFLFPFDKWGAKQNLRSAVGSTP
ncbi:signal peptidase I [Paenarthrobacter sp. S56]|uniref:signal peptidase I n=1 Tax=Paenarthrobacter sp. S56 TaxID=3138179 RepID=UPI0032190BED